MENTIASPFLSPWGEGEGGGKGEKRKKKRKNGIATPIKRMKPNN